MLLRVVEDGATDSFEPSCGLALLASTHLVKGSAKTSG
jgi:hypothetical protein